MVALDKVMSRLFKYAIIALIVVLTVAAMARADILLNRRQHATTTLTALTTSYASSSEDSATISLPGSAAEGDLAVLCDRAQSTGSSPTSVTPTGWTLVASTTADWVQYARQNLSYKILTASDISAGSVTGMLHSGTGAVHTRKYMTVFHGDAPIVTANLDDWAAEGLPFNRPASQTMDYSTYPWASISCISGSAATPPTVTFQQWTYSGSYVESSMTDSFTVRSCWTNDTYTTYSSRMADPGERLIHQSLLIGVE